MSVPTAMFTRSDCCAYSRQVSSPLSRQRILFLAARDDAKGSIRKRPLKCLRLGPGRRQPGLPLRASVRIAGIAFGCSAATSAFGSVVSSP